MKIIGGESSCSSDRIRPTEKAYSQSVFYCHKLAERTITPGGDRRCTPFLYPNNLQSTAWHRTLLRNIVISPQLPGLFSMAYLRDDGSRQCTRVCPCAFTWIRITWRLSAREREKKRGGCRRRFGREVIDRFQYNECR